MQAKSSMSFAHGQAGPSSSTSGAGGVFAPPASDTGVKDTWGESRLFFDWLSFMLPTGDIEAIEGRLSWVRDVLGPWVALDRGMLGYTHSAILCTSGRLMWSPDRPSQGVFISLPAQALHGFIGSAGWRWESFGAFLAFLIEAGARIRRLDAAIDAVNGELDLGVIEQYTREGWLVTRWKTAHFQAGLWADRGRTFYFGSRRSDTFMRIYNKTAERESRGARDELAAVAPASSSQPDGSDGSPSSPPDVVRVEVEFKHESAHALALVYLKEGPRGALAVIRGLIEFKEPGGGDSNKARWAAASWWASFLDEVGKLGLGVVKAARTIDSVSGWLRRCVAPSLAFFALYQGDGLDSISRLVASGAPRLKPWHVAALQGG